MSGRKETPPVPGLRPAGEDTAWDRLEDQEPQCGFGTLGICCRNCRMGPCRIDPFGDGPREGVCGATAEVIAARNLLRMIAAGAAAHSDHGRDVARLLLLTAQGKAGGFTIKDEKKLLALAAELKVETKGKDSASIARETAERLLAEFGRQEGELAFIQRAPEKRRKLWRESGFTPRGVDREIVEVMHRTHMGVDNDARNLLRQGIRTALADGWGGSMIATEASDILFRLPEPVRSRVNLGVLKSDEVNIVVHGHEPSLSDLLVDAARDPEIVKLAREKGAAGINLAGICCTANEILMRRGIPIAGNFLQQELAICTGAVELMLVDVQCILPSLGQLVQCYHTKLVSTSPKARFPGAEHVEFDERRGSEIARTILRMAIDNYPRRKQEKVAIPSDACTGLVAGFTPENIFRLLAGKNRSTYAPLNEAITSGRIRGIAALVGCNNPKIPHDRGHTEMAKELIRHDILVVSTGCAAIGMAKAGLLQPEAAAEFGGRGLQEVCEAVGVPPVLHLGSFVDCSRLLVTLCNILKEGGLGEDFSDLPVAAAAPEWMSEKAVSIGFYVVGSGIFTVLNPSLHVLGSNVL
ncbi:MAG: anaerobic carbon-monoxide dehydrogenase catalytic subunit, partial [Candidatus Aureabacteria bacterium]|nr:anaerobic carbon-monoxide dehydrogenase catalytic subunit [Candidatus Auribacterota bacterium]